MVDLVLFAHGITGRATNLSTFEYAPLGIEHTRWDRVERGTFAAMVVVGAVGAIVVAA